MDGQRLREGLRIIKCSPDQPVAPGQHVAPNMVSRCQGDTANVEKFCKPLPGKVDVKQRSNIESLHLFREI